MNETEETYVIDIICGAIVNPEESAHRLAFIRMSESLVALNSTHELMRDLGRPRGDMWEIALWEDVLTVEGNELYYTYQVDNQAVVILENIDAIRALAGLERDGAASTAKADAALGVAKVFLPTRAQPATVTG